MLKLTQLVYLTVLACSIHITAAADPYPSCGQNTPVVCSNNIPECRIIEGVLFHEPMCVTNDDQGNETGWADWEVYCTSQNNTFGIAVPACKKTGK